MMTPVMPFTSATLSRRNCADEPGHDRRPAANSGTWNCVLEVLTPLSIKSAFKADQRAVIPGSSLRGMVRNMAEVIGAGCARYLNTDDPRDAIVRPPANLAACSEVDACLVCRLFGFVQGQYAWAGKVRFTDAVGPVTVNWIRLHVPHHRPPHEASDGWILFRHSLPPPADPQGSILCLPVNAALPFKVHFTNLDPEELAVLRFCLTLSRNDLRYCHKLGYAKAAGLGSCLVSALDDRGQALPPIGVEIDPYLTDDVLDVLDDARTY